MTTVRIEIIDNVILHMRCCVILALGSLGEYYRDKGMLDKAITTLEECLEAQRSFLHPHHPLIGDS